MTHEIIMVEAGSANDELLARQALAVLTRHYPDHDWAVDVRSDQGIITIKNLGLSGNWGVILHLVNVQEDDRLLIVMRAGGEILERYRLRRGRANHERMAELPTDRAGRIICDRG